MKHFISSALIAVIVLTPSTALAAPAVQQSKKNAVVAPKPAETPKPLVYTVVEGDNLTKIGTANNVEWQRLYDKNTQIANPDLILIGDQVTIPLPSEQLQHRDIPAAVSLPAETPGIDSSKPIAAAAAPSAQASANYGSGNTYDYGYCTWYVKNRRGSTIPNNLGNANTWYSRAASQGMAVGSVPRPGAVGTTTRGSLGHVVYVESVNGDGSINISEMNAPTFGAVTYRTAAASEFLYIY